MHFAANFWREQTKSGREINAAIVNTTSTSGLFSNPGQANYDAAKTGIATLTQVAAKELVRYGVRANAIAPGARTRLTLSTPGLGDAIGPPDDGSFDEWSPANVSPFVAYLCTADCPITGETFVVRGGHVQRVQTWTLAEAIDQDDRWTVAELARRAGELRSRIPLEEGGMGAPQYRYD
jgi:NAD(P)-dependent dehydrogenase (short-subunit alcohol dehydrogenase family)